MVTEDIRTRIKNIDALLDNPEYKEFAEENDIIALQLIKKLLCKDLVDIQPTEELFECVRTCLHKANITLIPDNPFYAALDALREIEKRMK